MATRSASRCCWTVTASSTSGAIDEEALFYLRARGVSHAEATDLLTLAFLAEAVEEIEAEGLREEINGRLSSWLERRSS